MSGAGGEQGTAPDCARMHWVEAGGKRPHNVGSGDRGYLLNYENHGGALEDRLAPGRN